MSSDLPTEKPKPQVSCIIPTMNRPQLLQQTLTRLFESTAGIDVEAVVVIDESQESVEVCDRLIAEGKNIIYDYSPTRRGAITCWNLGLAMAHADYFVHQGDDADFENGWLGIALEAFQSKLQNFGLCGVNDQMHNGGQTVATHFLIDRAYCKQHMGGVMANPEFFYYEVDTWANAKARQVGRFYWCEEAKIVHIHPANGKRPVDETDLSHSEAWTHDINLMQQMRGAGLPITWEPVI